MKCPFCGKAKLIRCTHSTTYTYKGESTVIPIFGDHCKKCGETILDMEEATRMTERMKEFDKQVNSTIVDPVFIIKVRKKLKLDQKEASEIFGGGVNAFSRYENGKTKPPLSLVKLLKVLDRHPNLLTEIRTV